MILRKGDMFEHVEPNLGLVATGNNCITKYGNLVMGAGSAKSLAQFEPVLPIIFGHMLQHSTYDTYSIMITCLYHRLKFPLYYGLLATKGHWTNPSKLEVVLFNIDQFRQVITKQYKNITWRLAFPGINNGGLLDKKDIILEELKKLPDNVEVWERN